MPLDLPMMERRHSVRRMVFLESSSLSGESTRMETRPPSATTRLPWARSMPLDPPMMKTWIFFIGILTGGGRTRK
ncbi:hypothetical protein SESBI_03531 [Sesbania bispinosa]|nr:hypothetical protein SESBI_03531 [Sesbania bispinosa]